MSKKLRIGFIGCGGIAYGKHFPGMQNEAKKGNVELVAFCDIIEERAVKATKDYGCEGAKTYTDYKELLKDESIDAVHVLTPNVSHSQISCDALRAGKNVMCEKPMAATTEDAKKMLDAMNETGKLLTVGYQNRYAPVNRVAKDVIDDGYVGEVYYAKAKWLRRRGVPTWGVFLEKDKQGGGPNIDIGTHALDLALYMMNNYEVDYVVGTSFEKLGSLSPKEQGQTDEAMKANPWNNDTFEVEDSAFGYIKMKNGAVITLKSSWAINLPDEICNGLNFTLAGTKGGVDTTTGVVRLNHIVAGQKATTIVGKKATVDVPGFSAGSVKDFDETDVWVKALKGEGELLIKAQEAYVVTAILDAIYISNETGKPVYFD